MHTATRLFGIDVGAVQNWRISLGKILPEPFKLKSPYKRLHGIKSPLDGKHPKQRKVEFKSLVEVELWFVGSAFFSQQA